MDEIIKKVEAIVRRADAMAEDLDELRANTRLVLVALWEVNADVAETQRLAEVIGSFNKKVPILSGRGAVGVV